MTNSQIDTSRLNKHLALQLGISRREADNLIAAKKVSINEQIAQLGARFLPTDIITVEDKLVTTNTKLECIALNKPIGYVCSRRAQGELPTIYELLPEKYHHLKPVGRLDQNSSGIILLTNNGDFAYEMTHPKFYKQKIYHVQLTHSLEPLHQQMISDHGIQLEDGTSQFVITRLDVVPKEYPARNDTYEVLMREGRNRQIRRTFQALGYTVSMLHRVQFGNYSIGDIKPGKFINVDMQ
jgi:23S rRNA pseudouridine2605 synthase